MFVAARQTSSTLQQPGRHSKSPTQNKKRQLAETHKSTICTSRDVLPRGAITTKNDRNGVQTLDLPQMAMDLEF